MLRVIVLKRMESAVSSFALTVQRQLRDVEATLARIESPAEEVEEIDIEDVDVDNPGIIFCLRAEGEAAKRIAGDGYPLAPHYLVHVSKDGTVLLPYTQAKQILDRLKRLCLGRDLPDSGASARFDKATRDGKDMRTAQGLLAAAVASVGGKSEERAVASLFTPGRTHALRGEFAGINDFEVLAYLVVLPEYLHNTREYLEIALLRLTLRAGAKTVLDGEVTATACEDKRDAAYLADFCAALALGRQPRKTMHTLYQGWIDSLLALKAAHLTGAFRPATDPARAAARHEALGECPRLEIEIARLRTAAVKEKQMARQVELNLELKRVETALPAARAKL